MTSFFKRAWISAEVATRVAMPVTHPALEATHLEPAMTDAQMSQEIQRQQDDAAAHEMEHDRQERVESETSTPPTRVHDRQHSAAAPRPEAAVDRKQTQREAPQPQRRSEIAASAPTQTRDRSR